jgi:Spy/CpxP family protein refolding chaperone
MGPGLAGLKTLIELNLSDSQESVILGIIEKYERDRENTVNSLREARKNLRRALQAIEVNEEKVREAYRQTVPIREELLVMRARMMAELKTVLTAEQRQLLEDRKAQRLQRLKGRLGPWLEDRND